jgi:streptomycin 6-kinase
MGDGGELNLSAEFRQRQVDLFEAEGAGWLNQLPRLIADIEQRWSVQVQPPFPNLSYNYVAPAHLADGTAVVLKIGFPRLELHREIEALRFYDGQGMVRLLRAEPEQGIMLLERLQPGTPLIPLALRDDAAATRRAAQVMQQLRHPAPADHSFPTVANWGRGFARLRAEFNGRTGPFPAKLVDTAEQLFTELLASAAAPVLLHGDLHHDNILQAGNRPTRQPWLAIDPKGVIGEPAYEVGALLRNPIPHIFQESPDNLRRRQARRLDILAEMLTIDRQRLWGWSLAQAVLSAWWSYEDGEPGWKPMLRLAEQVAGCR